MITIDIVKLSHAHSHMRIRQNGCWQKFGQKKLKAIVGLPSNMVTSKDIWKICLVLEQDVRKWELTIM